MKFTVYTMNCKFDEQAALLTDQLETSKKQLLIMDDQTNQLERLRATNNSMAEKMKVMNSAGHGKEF